VGDFRARDADRDHYVDVIEAAYVDGQLGDADREVRVSRALVAETLDELEGLTRDLQNRPDPASPRTSTPVAPAPARPTVPPSITAGKVVGVAAAGLAGLAVLGVLAAGQSVPQTSWSSMPTPRVMTDSSSSPRFTMNTAWVREFVSSYQARFGSLEPYEVTFFPRRVVVQVPVPGQSARPEVWSWDGTWTKDADRAAMVEPHARVDLGDLDARRLVDNIRTARGALRVEQGQFGRAGLSRSGDGPAVVTIHITNQFHETGSLTTTPSGEILGRQPYAR
jgi:hypothetical protein